MVAAGAKSGTISTGRAARRMKVPLHVAVYRDQEDDCYAGNRELLAAGATPLMWNPAQEAVNMSRVWQNVRAAKERETEVLCGQS